MKKTHTARKPDLSRRCPVCFSGPELYGEPRYGTLMICELIHLREKGKPGQAIAKLERCGRAGCTGTHTITPFTGFSALGVPLLNLYALTRAWHGSPSFTLAEMKAGRMDLPGMPAPVAAMVQPVLGSNYNPDAHIEPRGMPAPQEMF